MLITLVVFAIVLSFAIPKFLNIADKTNLTKLKSEVALIQNGITKAKTNNILLGKDENITILDEAKNNTKDEKLFTKVVDLPIIATNSSIKQKGFWSKIDDKNYQFYLSDEKMVLYSFEDYKFVCKSSFDLCQEVQ